MASTEAEVTRQRCAVHPDRPAVELCASCGRAACLPCAIPFRGRVLCRSCAAREVGAEIVEAPPRPALRPDVVASAFLVVGLLATIPPWHRSGTLTSVLTAWRPGLSLAVCLSLLTAFLLSAVPAVGRAWPAPLALGGSAVAALAAAAITAFSLATAPDYFSPTPAPFVALGAAAAAAAVGFVRFVLLPR